MKNNSTPKEEKKELADLMDKIGAGVGSEVTEADSTPSEGWDLESLIAQEIGYISGIFMSQGNTKAKDIIMPTEELKEVADRINLYCLKEIAKARQEVMMTELVHCEEAIERARQETRQEIKEWVESYNKRSDGINKSDLLKELEEEK